jgi:hypothetical protein
MAIRTMDTSALIEALNREEEPFDNCPFCNEDGEHESECETCDGSGVCPECAGNGDGPGGECPRCHGSGDCPDCDGEGYKVEPCEHCYDGYVDLSVTWGHAFWIANSVEYGLVEDWETSRRRALELGALLVQHPDDGDIYMIMLSCGYDFTWRLALLDLELTGYLDIDYVLNMQRGGYVFVGKKDVKRLAKEAAEVLRARARSMMSDAADFEEIANVPEEYGDVIKWRIAKRENQKRLTEKVQAWVDTLPDDDPLALHPRIVATTRWDALPGRLVNITYLVDDPAKLPDNPYSGMVSELTKKNVMPWIQVSLRRAQDEGLQIVVNLDDFTFDSRNEAV